MSSPHNIHWSDRVFAERPQQWGLRGDPELWTALHESLRGGEQPTGSDDFLARLRTASAEIIGLDITESSASQVQVDGFDESGMSGGRVSPEFWRDTAIPMLLERFDATSETA